MRNWGDVVVQQPDLQASLQWHNKAQEILRPYVKQARPEAEIRELIKRAGVRTFPRPLGIPEHYEVRITERGAGMEYYDPKKPGCSVRVMPGKEHNFHLCQRDPYVIHMQDGQTLDKQGRAVLHHSEEAHIPLEDFVYRPDFTARSTI
jgi:hypothetical protein